jgi:hypothetical protein
VNAIPNLLIIVIEKVNNQIIFGNRIGGSFVKKGEHWMPGVTNE